MQNKWRNRKIAFGAILILSSVVVGISLFFRGLSGTTDEGLPPVYLNENQSERYYTITFGEMKEYGLAPKDAVGLTRENKYEITTADLGQWIGTVTDCLDRSMINCKVYSFAKYPDDKSICIIATPTGYQFYTLYPYE